MQGSVAGAVATLLAVLLTGCTGDEEPAPGPSGGGAPVVQLGAPGQPNRELTDDEVAALGNAEDEASASDIAFARDMVPHHEQALRMAELAADRGGRDVALLAERMRVSQTDEVALLQRWLAEQGPLPPDDHARHGGDAHALMPGMLTDAQLAELAAATGDRFDELFLTAMIRHHEGATMMVADLFTRADGGQHPWLAQLARDIDIDQRVEIARMRALLAGA
ncbi:DUF305 domain-containing protein [Oryzobacter sp. R7]|uniref:DUF305 domain-containing protein n=1 Tax=Oryzobacter faecalis TaxID=3388656 RepID=UPI00398CAD1B